MLNRISRDSSVICPAAYRSVTSAQAQEEEEEALQMSVWLKMEWQKEQEQQQQQQQEQEQLTHHVNQAQSETL